MREFIFGNQQQWRQLQTDAAGKCIKFLAREMLPGIEPAHADIGFEHHPESGVSILYIDHGLTGDNLLPDVGDWLMRGEIAFRSWEELRLWCAYLSVAYLQQLNDTSRASGDE